MLDDLHLFIEIARRKSMSQTAKDLGLNLSTLSRRIQALEDYSLSHYCNAQPEALC